MIGTVAGEVAIGIPQPRDLIGTLGAFRVIHNIRYSKPQPVDVKPNAVVHIRQIKPEVAEATDFEGLVEENSADIKFIRRGRHDAPPKARNSNLIYNVRALSTTLRQRMMEKWSVGVMGFATLQYSNTTPEFFVRYERNRYLIFLRMPRPSRFFSSNQTRRNQLRKNQAKDVEVQIHWWSNSKSALNFLIWSVLPNFRLKIDFTLTALRDSTNTVMVSIGSRSLTRVIFCANPTSLLALTSKMLFSNSGSWPLSILCSASLRSRISCPRSSSYPATTK